MKQPKVIFSHQLLRLGPFIATNVGKINTRRALHNYKIAPTEIVADDGLVEMYFESDEDLLFERATWSSSAYNTIIYAIAMHLRKKEPLSERLQEFLINHLMHAPQPKNSKLAGGQKKPQNKFTRNK